MRPRSSCRRARRRCRWRSPRSSRRCRRAESNAEVAKADIVFLGMRPMHLEEAMAGIDFGAARSSPAWSRASRSPTSARAGPRPTVCRFIPMPGIARGKGPMATYPAVPEIVELMSPLGDLFVVQRREQARLRRAQCLHVELLRAAAGADRGRAPAPVSAESRCARLRRVAAGHAGRHGAAHARRGFGSLVEEHQTKGGLNERVRAALLAQGWFDAPRAALNATTTLSYKKLG